ncbi:MAG: hypothetical protein IPM63_11785 [Acidobacteriota bacterium]|nr:MAG: hypothetical protein IPM63_11785 [Acidobacteriota bacterium]
MPVSITMSFGRRNNEPNSNITYFYDNCDIDRFGIGGIVIKDGGVGIGLMMQRIVNSRIMDFAKIIDPAVTQRLQRAFNQKKKFRKVGLHVHEHSSYTTTYSIEFEDVMVVSLKQQFEPKVYGIPLLMDIVSIQAGYSELR